MTMWKPLAVCAVAVLVLTGCSAAPEEIAPQVAEVEIPEEVREPSPDSAAPLTMAPEEPAADLTPEEHFLEYMRGASDFLGLKEASDAQFLDAGRKACEQMAAGATTLQVQVIEGEEMVGGVLYEASRAIAINANEYLCPEIETR